MRNLRKAAVTVLAGVAMAVAGASTASAATPPKPVKPVPATVSYHMLTPVDGNPATFVNLLAPKVSKTYLNTTLYPRVDNSDYEADHPALCTHKFVRHTHQKVVKWTCKGVPRAQAPAFALTTTAR